MSLNIKFKKLHKGAKIPSKATVNSAAYDLYCVEDFFLFNGSTKLIKLGFSTEIPVGWCAKITPRSGLAIKEGITIVNSPGIIDSDYRGEWGVIVLRAGIIGCTPYKAFRKGDRVAQVLFEPCHNASFEVVDEINETERTGGFGSTGK